MKTREASFLNIYYYAIADQIGKFRFRSDHYVNHAWVSMEEAIQKLGVKKDAECLRLFLNSKRPFREIFLI